MIRVKNPNPVVARLPNEYEEVEYIESTGTQYIDTGHTPTSSTEIIIKNVVCPKRSDFQTIFSAGTGTYQWILILAKTSENVGAYYKYFSSTTQDVPSTYVLDTPTTIRSLAYLYYNDTQVALSTYTGTVNTTLRLLTRANGETPANARIGETIIQSGGTIHRKLIPCYRKSDNVVGMYDIANNVFYTNAGTGTFLMGDEVVRRDMNIYPNIGTKKVLKRYIKNTLVYELKKEFLGCPFPTSWEKVTLGTRYSASNDLGYWECYANDYYNTSTYCYEAFDGDDSTCHRPGQNPTSTSTFAKYIGIDLPANIQIKPTRIKLIVSRLGTSSNPSILQGFNSKTGEWEDLYSFYVTSASATTLSPDITTDNFYSNFRIKQTRSTSSSSFVPSVYTFEITSGFIKGG